MGAGALKDKKNAHGRSSCPAQQILVIEMPPYPHPITLSTWGGVLYQLHTRVTWKKYLGLLPSEEDS